LLNASLPELRENFQEKIILILFLFSTTYATEPASESVPT